MMKREAETATRLIRGFVMYYVPTELTIMTYLCMSTRENSVEEREDSIQKLIREATVKVTNTTFSHTIISVKKYIFESFVCTKVGIIRD